jgi:hypothetical protein
LIARWIIDKAIERLPADDRQRFREEWLAHLDETPGALRKICHAIGCYLCAAKLAKIRLRCPERIARAEKMLALLDWLAEEVKRLPEGGRLDAPDRVEALANKLIELKFTEDEDKFFAWLLTEARDRLGI